MHVAEGPEGSAVKLAIARLPALVTRRQAAELLGISVGTWERWAKLGRIGPGVKIGRLRRWPKEELERAARGDAPCPQ